MQQLPNKMSLRLWNNRITILALMLFAEFILLLLLGYSLNLPGVRAKTLWGRLQLFIIPVALVIGGLWLNQRQKNRERILMELLTKNVQNSAPSQSPVDTGSALDFWQLILPYLLVGIGIGIVTFLVFHTNMNNQAFMTPGISAIVGLVGFLAGHAAASVGRDKSEQRIIEAMQRKH